jgi:hypothetical protein
MLNDIIIGLLSSFTFLVLSFSLKAAYGYYKVLKLKIIWTPFTNSSMVNVVLSTRPGPHARSSPRLSMTELSAYVQVSNTLNKIGVKATPLSSNLQLGDIRGKDLVLLGGPLANDVTKLLWDDILERLPYDFNLEKQIIKSTNNKYSPQLGEEGHLISDYAILLKISDLTDASGCLLLSMGCHGYGTKAGIDMMTVDSYQKILKQAAKGNDFVAIIGAVMNKGGITNINLLECFVISDLQRKDLTKSSSGRKKERAA